MKKQPKTLRVYALLVSDIAQPADLYTKWFAVTMYREEADASCSADEHVVAYDLVPVRRKAKAKVRK